MKLPRSVQSCAAIATLVCAASLSGCAGEPEESPMMLSPTLTAPAGGLQLEGLSDTVKDIEARTNTQVGVSLYDGSEHTSAGILAVLPAWSTIKVPIALAADEHCEYADEVIAELTDAAIEWSDNDSASALWTCLGPDAEASRLVGEEIGKAGVSVQVEPYFGTTDWPVTDQAQYAHYLASLPEDNVVIKDMRLIDAEHRYGLGQIAGVPFKGGWSDAPDGSWHSRQMGFTTVGGTTYGIAIAARSADGSEEDATEALNAVAAFITDAGAA